MVASQPLVPTWNDPCVTGLELSARWWGLYEVTEAAERKRTAISAELNREIAPGHVTYGKIVRVEGFFEASDDVIVRLVDGTFALVHPTWSRRPESGPYPRTRRLGDAAAAFEAIAERETLW
ncbi:hypothetical protein ACFQ1S_05035 [Kibdelosporangium lantanae]|uniref:Uncharacterized protein n=1 Tax=Kibdelosporangium lantanae TaxID=1497396 RepID=A0ABW3M380_9PSEU